ncbi:MAG: hypothetical protein ACMVP2_19845 [Imperialibacter sp.]|uniref:hypothetical protein n=1 Tax=Imperialibacter sp. TaxID=2038411 RepID=UPI003A83DB90
MRILILLAATLVIFIGNGNAQSTRWTNLNLLGDLYTIDGYISAREVLDTTQMQYDIKSHKFFIKKSQHFTYIAIRSNTSSILNTYLVSEDVITVLHASAALGQIDFVKHHHTFKPLKTEFDWIYRDPVAWQEQHEDGVDTIQEFYNLFGWMANTWHSGSYREMEMIIDNTLMDENTKIVISYTSKEDELYGIRFKIGTEDTSLSGDESIDNQLHNGYIPATINLNDSLSLN